MKKKVWLIVGSLVLISALLTTTTVSCGGTEPVPEPTGPIVLKSVTFVPPHLPEADAFHHFIELVGQRSNGELTIEVTGGPEAIPGFEQPEAIRSGVVDMALTVQPYYVSIVPEMFGQQVMKVTSREAYENGLYDLFNEAHKKQGLAYLGPSTVSSGFYLWTKDKITTPQGFKGYKMRGGPNYAPLLNALGAAQVTMPISDAYSGLERGVINGIAIVLTEIQSRKLYEHVKYCVDHKFNEGAPLMVIMNLSAFESLPEHLQKILIEAGIDMGTWAEQRVPGIEEGVRKFLVDEAGIEFVKFSPADAKYFLDTADQEMLAELRKRVPESADKIWELAGN